MFFVCLSNAWHRLEWDLSLSLASEAPPAGQLWSLHPKMLDYKKIHIIMEWAEKFFFLCWWWICRLSLFLSVSVWALSGIWQPKPVEPRTPSHREPVEPAQPIEPCLKGQFSQISFDIRSEYDDHKLLEFVLFSFFFLPLSAPFLTFAKSFQARLLQRGESLSCACVQILDLAPVQLKI